MPDLLLELFSEEIPARMQGRAESDLHKAMCEGLTAAGLTVGETQSFSGPRRLAFIASGLPTQSAATIEERKGPRVGAPDKAIAGFLKSAGITDLNACDVVKDAKGDYYVARVQKPGRAASVIVAEIVTETVRTFSWQKSMRWGNGRMRWVRPLHSILCLLDAEAVEFEVDGVKSGGVTKGHRFARGEKGTTTQLLEISSSVSYTAELLHAKVVSARERRVQIILEGARKVAGEAALDLVEDHGLLDENAGLVEWPVVHAGQFDKAFLNVPQEILITAMRSHQKYFSLKDRSTGRLTNTFVLVANLAAQDGGRAIVEGNERVIRARLSDAEFFWKADVAKPLGDLVASLNAVTFHEKLGTQLERVARIRRLARELASFVSADPELTDRAALLCKADLLTGTVGEFPELQGVIGSYIAAAQGEHPSVSEAIRAHYRPQGPSDAVAANAVGIAVALADKLDLLTGFWEIGEKPTGSKDPFGLRRAALGVIRTILENDIRLRLVELLSMHFALMRGFLKKNSDGSYGRPKGEGSQPGALSLTAARAATERRADDEAVTLMAFFADRLKVYLREKGERHDLIDAVFALPGQEDLVLIVKRVEALGRFLKTEDGASLLALVRRALNILRIEEKKDGRIFDGKPAPRLLRNKEEKALSAAIKSVTKAVEAALANDDFGSAMTALAGLRAPVDTFFEAVIVNADDSDVRENRLKLLANIRQLTNNVADFAKIEG